MSLLKHLSIGLLYVLLSVTLSAQGAVPTIQTQEDFKLGETLTFNSDILKEERTLNIYFPYSYDKDTTKHFPVIYLLDGSADEDFIHITGLIQFGTFPWVNMLPESILVGIANVDRKRDFTYPTANAKDKADFPTTGGSAAFIDFLAREVQPLINANFRTVDTTTLIGQSLGGLLATEILFERAPLFDNYIIISPSLWWDDDSLLTRTPDFTNLKGQVYLAVGEEGPYMKRVAYELLAKLMKAEVRVHFDYLGGQDHGNILHQAVYQAFGRMYPTKE